jgi:thiol-disulfide isomerase/thioredoxin
MPIPPLRRRAALLAGLGLPFARAAAAGGSALQPLAGAQGWMNSAPLTPASLRGRVVLLDFWTYSCINCLRTLPYVRAWAAKYRLHGLVVIGVHTPEFTFEQQPRNVQHATRDLAVAFPVVLDADRSIWRASDVEGWPTLDFIDAQGRRRHRQVGEGEYEQSERVLQQLLREAGARDVPTDLVTPTGMGTQAAAGPGLAGSDETYLGAAKAEGFVAAQGQLRQGRARSFVAAPRLRAGEWTLSGAWDVADEYIEARQPQGAITYRFRARDVHLVLGPAQDARPVPFRIRIDGQPPGPDHGTDVNAAGNGVVDVHRLYQLVRQTQPQRERLVEIRFQEPGVRAYAFTFG